MFKIGDVIVSIEWCLFQFGGAYFNFGTLVSIEDTGGSRGVALGEAKFFRESLIKTLNRSLSGFHPKSVQYVPHMY